MHLIALQPGETPAPINAQFTKAMRAALLAAAAGPLARWRHGWARRSTDVAAASSQTVEALRARGLVALHTAVINGRRRRLQSAAVLTDRGVWFARTLLAQQQREAA
jgi:hypothetical protein